MRSARCGLAPVVRSIAFVGALAVPFLAPRASLAQSNAADVSLARQLGNEGLALATSGDCAGAVEKLKRAEGLYHAPTTLTVLGECHIAIGKLVDGVEELTRVVREDLGPRPLPAFRKAQIRARQKLDDARPRVPKLKLSVDGAHADTALSVRIDGMNVPSATLGLDRPVDPGPHDIEVTALGYKPASAHVVAKEGVTLPLKLQLEPVFAAVAPPPPPPEPSPPPVAIIPSEIPSAPRESKASYLPAGILLGVGIGGIGVGAALGIMTLNKASQLNGACQPRNACPAGEQGDIDSAGTSALGSTIAFGVGALGVGFGTYFLLKPPRTDVEVASAGVHVRPWIGPGSAGLTGSF